MWGGGGGEAFLAFILAVLQPVTELLWKPRVQGSGCCCLKAACPDISRGRRAVWLPMNAGLGTLGFTDTPDGSFLSPTHLHTHSLQARPPISSSEMDTAPPAGWQ